MILEDTLRALAACWSARLGQHVRSIYGIDFDTGRDAALSGCRTQLLAALDAFARAPLPVGSVGTLLEQMWARVAELNSRGEAGVFLAAELSRWAYELQQAVAWTKVSEALPEEGRPCWVWFEGAKGGQERVRASLRNGVWMGAGVDPNNAYVFLAQHYTAHCWQYEIVPPEPTREVVP